MGNAQYVTFIMSASPQSLSSCVVSLSQNTRSHSCRQSATRYLLVKNKGSVWANSVGLWEIQHVPFWRAYGPAIRRPFGFVIHSLEPVSFR